VTDPRARALAEAALEVGRARAALLAELRAVLVGPNLTDAEWRAAVEPLVRRLCGLEGDGGRC